MHTGPFSVAPAAAADMARPLPRTRRRSGRIGTIVLSVSVLLAVIVALGAAEGVRRAVVLTGSMEPALSPNDLILTKRSQAADVRAGQIISFAAPGSSGVVITHRVRSAEPADGGRIAFVTKGDANDTVERWTIPADGTVARVVGVAPGVGAVTDWAGSASGRLFVFGFIGLLLLVIGLRWVWRER